MKKDPIEQTIPQQEWTKYNRESGKKTLYLVAVFLVLIVGIIATIAVLYFGKK